MGLSTQIKFDKQYMVELGNNWIWFLLWGIAIFALGLFAISASALTTLISIIILGILLLTSGLFIIFDAFTFWRGKGSGFLLHIIMGLLYLITGIMIINKPYIGSISITFLLGIFFIIVGIARIAYSVAIQMPRWGWTFFNGIITLLLGTLILAEWPESSLFIIGLFVGIDLVFCGWAYIMVALAARSLMKE